MNTDNLTNLEKTLLTESILSMLDVKHVDGIGCTAFDSDTTEFPFVSLDNNSYKIHTQPMRVFPEIKYSIGDIYHFFYNFLFVCNPVANVGNPPLKYCMKELYDHRIEHCIYSSLNERHLSGYGLTSKHLSDIPLYQTVACPGKMNAGVIVYSTNSYGSNSFGILITSPHLFFTTDRI